MAATCISMWEKLIWIIKWTNKRKRFSIHAPTTEVVTKVFVLSPMVAKSRSSFPLQFAEPRRLDDGLNILCLILFRTVFNIGRGYVIGCCLLGGGTDIALVMLSNLMLWCLVGRNILSVKHVNNYNQSIATHGQIFYNNKVNNVFL